MIDKRRDTPVDLYSLWWFRGLPAIFVATISCTVAFYLTVILPSRLPAHYKQHLATSLARYDSSLERLSDRELIELGSEVAIAYSRVQGFQDSEPTWEEASFYHRHLQNLSQQASESEHDRDLLQDSIATFRGKRDKLFESFSEKDSPFCRLANIAIASETLDGPVRRPQADLIDNLKYLVRESPDDAEVRNMLLRILIRKSWHPRGEDGCPADSFLSQAAGLLSDVDRPNLKFSIGDQLELLAFTDIAQARVLATAVASSPSEHLFENVVQAKSILGDWPEVEKWLSQRLAVANKEEAMEIRSEFSDFILRLFFSDLVADKAWATDCAAGLKLANKLYPANHRAPAVVWRLARLHANDQAKLAAESVLLSDQPERLLLLALSGALRGSSEAPKYLSQAVASLPNTYTQLGVICVTEPIANEELPPLIELLKIHTRQAPEMHLALAKLLLQAQDYSAAQDQLDSVREELGETPLFKQLDSQLSRMLGPNA